MAQVQVSSLNNSRPIEPTQSANVPNKNHEAKLIKIGTVALQTLTKLNVPHTDKVLSDMRPVCDYVLRTDLVFKDKAKSSDKNIITLDRFYHKDKSDMFFLVSKIQQYVSTEKLKDNPDDMDVRLQYVKNSFNVAESFRDLESNLKPKEAEEIILADIAEVAKEAKELDIFHSCSYFIKALIMEYKGVDCSNIKEVIKLVELLTVAHNLEFYSTDNNTDDRNLDAKPTEIKAMLLTAISQAKNRWNSMNVQSNRKEDKKFETWNEELDLLETPKFMDNFFKDLIIEDKSILGRANLTLMKQYPYLESKKACLKKFPELEYLFDSPLKSKAQRAQEVPSGTKTEPVKSNAETARILPLPKDLSDINAVRQALKNARGTSFVLNLANVNNINKRVVTEKLAQAISEEWKFNPNFSVVVSQLSEIEVIKDKFNQIFKNAPINLVRSDATIKSNNSIYNIYALSVNNT